MRCAPTPMSDWDVPESDDEEDFDSYSNDDKDILEQYGYGVPTASRLGGGHVLAALPAAARAAQGETAGAESESIGVPTVSSDFGVPAGAAGATGAAALLAGVFAVNVVRRLVSGKGRCIVRRVRSDGSVARSGGAGGGVGGHAADVDAPIASV